MPVHVDVERRLDEIARATIAVARRRGAAGITIRDVARELGGSTARVTNYVPNRTALVGTAVTYMLREWKRRRDADLAGLPDGEQLLALARWAASADPDDLVFLHLLVELMSQRTTGLSLYYDDAQAFRDDLATAAALTGAEDADVVADLMFLLIRGFHYVTVEGWDGLDAARADALLAGVVALLTPR